MEEWKEVRAQPFQPKAKSSQTEKEDEESLIPEGFEFFL